MRSSLTTGKMRPLGFLPHESFKSIKNHLTIYRNKKPDKFCRKCGHIHRANTKLLREHYERWHDNEKPEYLLYGEFPLECKYINFSDYLKDPTTELEELSGYKKNKGGPISKDKVKKMI